MTSPLPELVTQAQWAEHLGVSTGTFLRWRRQGVRTRLSGRIEIPAPVDLPGWPRWKREDVLRVTRLLLNGKRRLFVRGEQCSAQPLSAHAEQSLGDNYRTRLSGKASSDFHAAHGDSAAKTNPVMVHDQKVSA